MTSMSWSMARHHHHQGLLPVFLLALVVVLAGRCWLPGASASDLWRRVGGNEYSRSVTVLNQSGLKVDIFWVHYNTGKLQESHTKGEGVPFGGDSHISSYVGHTFEIQEMKDRLGNCRKKICKSVRFTVSSNEDQEYTVWKNFSVTVEDDYTRALEKAKVTVQDCLGDQTLLMASDGTTPGATEEQIAKLTECVDARVKQAIEEIEDEIAFQAGLRMNMGQDLTKYICRDEAKAKLTESLANLTWKFKSFSTKMEHEYHIETLFDAFDSSSAVLIEEFISPQQCAALESFAQDDTTTAEISDGENAYPSFVTTFSIPGSAKGDMDAIDVLMKMQGYVKSTMDKPLSYRNKERLLTQYVLHAAPQDSTTVCGNALSSELGGEDAAAAIDDLDQATECTPGDKAAVGDKNVASNSFERYYVPSNASGTVILFCSSTGGAVHFPRTGVHIPAADVVGRALFVWHQETFVNGEDGTELGDIYMGEYALCQPQEPGSTMNIFVTSFTL